MTAQESSGLQDSLDEVPPLRMPLGMEAIWGRGKSRDGDARYVHGRGDDDDDGLQDQEGEQAEEEDLVQEEMIEDYDLDGDGDGDGDDRMLGWDTEDEEQHLMMEQG